MSNAREQAIEILRDWMRHQRGPAWDLGKAVDALIAADLLPTSGPEPTEERRPTSDSFRQLANDERESMTDGSWQRRLDEFDSRGLALTAAALMAAEPEHLPSKAPADK